MDIHKPKPWHGLREFLKEYVIIVVGVLTALGGEQLVEHLRQRGELAETREAIREEIAENALNADVTAREQRCLSGVLDGLLDWADGKRERPEPPMAVSPFFTTTVWNGSQSVVAHMPLKEKFALGHFYEYMSNEQALAVTLRAQSTRLARYYGRDRPNAEEARVLRQDVAETRIIGATMRRNALWMMGMARERGAPAKPMTRGLRRQIARECVIGNVPPPDFDTPEGLSAGGIPLGDGKPAAAGK
jgi:hypothetical protein